MICLLDEEIPGHGEPFTGREKVKGIVSRLGFRVTEVPSGIKSSRRSQLAQLLPRQYPSVSELNETEPHSQSVDIIPYHSQATHEHTGSTAQIFIRPFC